MHEAQSSLLHLTETELRLPTQPVAQIDDTLQSGIENMLRLLRRTGYPAVTGPQIGLPKKVVAVDLSRTGRSPVVLVNPVVTGVSPERSVDLEGCLNLPGLLAKIRRPQHVRVTGLARTGQVVHVEVGGLLARILQHKIDHLEGTLFLDHLTARERILLQQRARQIAPCCMLPEEAAVA